MIQWSRPIEMEDTEKPSFENFISRPLTLTDHLMWQLGSLHVNEDVYRAAELVIGNLNEEGYLTASDDELLGLADEEQPLLREPPPPPVAAAVHADAPEPAVVAHASAAHASQAEAIGFASRLPLRRQRPKSAPGKSRLNQSMQVSARPTLVPPRTEPARVPFSRDALREAIDLVRQMDPIGVGARDLRECLSAQLQALKHLQRKNGNGHQAAELEALDDAIVMVDQHLHALQNKNYKEVAKAMGRPLER